MSNTFRVIFPSGKSTKRYTGDEISCAVRDGIIPQDARVEMDGELVSLNVFFVAYDPLGNKEATASGTTHGGRLSDFADVAGWMCAEAIMAILALMALVLAYYLCIEFVLKKTIR